MFFLFHQGVWSVLGWERGAKHALRGWYAAAHDSQRVDNSSQTNRREKSSTARYFRHHNLSGMIHVITV